MAAERQGDSGGAGSESSAAGGPDGGSGEPSPGADTGLDVVSAKATAAEPGPEELPLPAGVHQLCGCGRSRHGWFCDGAHLGSGRVSHELRLSEPTTLLLCGCGRSGRYPLCDGRHARPPRRRWWRFWR